MPTFSQEPPSDNAIWLKASEFKVPISDTREEHIREVGCFLHNATRRTEDGEVVLGDTFNDDNFDIGLFFINEPDTQFVNIDYFPLVDGVPIASPNREHLCWLLTHAIESLQNYCLIVESGYIRAPNALTGLTNIRTAVLARRVGFTDNSGFEEAKKDDLIPVSISVPYPMLAEKVFSDRMRRITALLAKRQLRNKNS
jgi:hypothetical protein